VVVNLAVLDGGVCWMVVVHGTTGLGAYKKLKTRTSHILGGYYF
jgi:hypothetical protein